MPTSKPQLAIYAALAIAILLIGSRFLREGGEAAAPTAAPLAGEISSSEPDGLGSAPGGLDGNPAGRAAPLVVDVKGAVRRPGVYRLPAGARTYDAVRRAGGLTRRADRVGVNLAARVVDGGEVVVPLRGRTARGSLGTADGAGSGASTGAGTAATPLALDLNTASAEELEQLDGVGPALAAAIVAYREEQGGFASIDELDEVSGIGEARLAAIRTQLGQ